MKIDSTFVTRDFETIPKFGVVQQGMRNLCVKIAIWDIRRTVGYESKDFRLEHYIVDNIAVGLTGRRREA